MEVEKSLNDAEISKNDEPLHPFLALKRKKKPLSKAVAQSLMGVSALLNHARSMITLNLDGEEHEVTESLDGTYQYQIDGQELTFESWSKLSASDNSVASCKNKRQFRSKIKLNPNILRFDLEPPPLPPKLTSSPKGMPSSSSTTKKRKRSSLEEGEIASWSSSDDDSDIEIIQVKSKRAATREQQRQNVQNNPNDMKKRMEIIFDNRHNIAPYFNTTQKVQMLHSLRMVYGQHDEIMKNNEKMANYLSNP